MSVRHLPARPVRAAIAAILGGTLILQLPTASAATPANAELDEVTVTGSRIQRRDQVANSPLVTVEAQAFDESSTLGVETILNQLPQFVPANTQFIAADIQPGSTNTVGSSSLNMRGLGSNRTLVLIDGRRAQPANASLVIDTNSIPSAALASVEIISGGASAVYGADAMGGVTNFKLRDNFHGASIDARYGITEVGDGEEYRVSALLGTSIGGEGNVMLGVEWTRRELAKWHERGFFRDELTDSTSTGARILSRFNAPGYEPMSNQPSQDAANALFADRTGNIPRGGIFLFNDDNSLFRLEQNGIGFKGPVGTGQYKIVGGTLRENELDTWLSSPLERFSLFGRAKFELGRGISAFSRVNFASTDVLSSRQRGAPIYSGFSASVPFSATELYAPSLDEGGSTRPEYGAGGSLGLNCTALAQGCTVGEVWPVPDDLRSLLVSRGANVYSTTEFDPATGNPVITAGADAPWRMGLVPLFLPLRTTTNRTQLYQILAGVEGRLGLGDWTWEAYASRGETHTTAAYGGNVSTQRWANLIASPNYGRGATFDGGTVTCTSGIPIFERFEVTQDCKDLVTVNTVDRTDLTQEIFEANLQGGLFWLPAGQVRSAVGVSYRKNDFSFTPDPARDVNNIIDVPAGVFRASWTGGQTKVSEVYGEVLVPLLSDLPLAHALELELGARYSDYNPGSRVPTYKALLSWAPHQTVRFRGGYQLANRAPNIDELFRGVTNTVVGGVDPCLSAGTGSVSWGNAPDNTANRQQIQQLCSAIIGSGASDFDADPDNYVANIAGVAGVEIAVSSGNPDLKSEKGKTWTFGVVLNSPFQSPAAQNMSLTVDWYKAKISEAIAPVSNVTAYELCFNRNGVSNPDYLLNDPLGMCQRIERDEVSGARVRTFTPFANLGTLQTSGIDLSFAWRTALADIGMASLPGSLSLNVSANYLLDFKSQDFPGSPLLVLAGTANRGGLFDYRGVTTLRYINNAFQAGMTWRFYPELDHALVPTTPDTTSQGVTGSYSLFNVFGGYEVNDNLTISGGIDNLLNRDPPIYGRTPTSLQLGQTLTNLYDVLGRRFYLTARLRF